MTSEDEERAGGGTQVYNSDGQPVNVDLSSIRQQFPEASTTPQESETPIPAAQPPYRGGGRGGGGGSRGGRGMGKAIVGTIMIIFGCIMMGYAFVNIGTESTGVLVFGIILFLFGTMLISWSLAEQGRKTHFPWGGRRRRRYYY